MAFNLSIAADAWSLQTSFLLNFFLMQLLLANFRAGFASLGCQTSAVNMKKLNKPELRWQQVHRNSHFNESLLPLRVSCNQKSAKDWRNTWEFLSKLKKTSPQQIYDARIKSPVGDISVVTLIKADVTLDHSQKAEKVCETQNVQHFFQTKKKPNVIESGFAFAKSTISKPTIKQTMWLEVARKQTTSKEILLWMIPAEALKALQTSVQW